MRAISDELCETAAKLVREMYSGGGPYVDWNRRALKVLEQIASHIVKVKTVNGIRVAKRVKDGDDT